MKRLLTILIAVGCAAVAYPQTEQADTTQAQALQEVVVNGRIQRIVKFGMEYLPSKREKRAAIDASSLLRMMNVPQLNVSPEGKVSTVTGEGITMFIDYAPATQQDLKGLRPEDVLRVEVLQYPDDPRFNSAANVVNFIMRKYEWGGYTKLTLVGKVLNVEMGATEVYSKFVKGKWTIDANANGAIQYSGRDYGSNLTETFRDFNYDGNHIAEVSRITSGGLDNVSKVNSQSASARFSYQTVNTLIRHTLSYNRYGAPCLRETSAVTFSDDLLPSSKAITKETRQNITPSINAYYFFNLPKGNSLNINWEFAYTNTHKNSSYQLGELSPILNINREDSYAPVGTIQYSKRFGHNNTFSTTLISYNCIYDTHYAGSYNDTQKLLSSENLMFLEYRQNWKFGLSLYSRIGMSYVLGRVNGVNTLQQWNPRLGMQLQYRISQNHSASLEGWWGNSHPQASSYNSAIVQSDELLWFQGNPDLKNTIFHTVRASYNWIPNNKFSLTATLKYDGNSNKQAWDFLTLPGYNGLVRRLVNSGNYHDYSSWLTATLRLFNNSLSLRGSVQFDHNVLTGIDRQSLNEVTAQVQANYFLKNLAFSIYYDTPQHHLNAWSKGVREYFKSTCGISVNYAVGDFKCSLTYSNWFSNDKIYMSFDSPHYALHGWRENADFHQNLRLTLSYTIPYGKKVDQRDELSGNQKANSAILE